MKRSEKKGYRGRSSLSNVIGVIGLVIIMLLWTIGCSSGPSQSPEDLVRSFLAKHLSMSDLSLAQYYDKNEQPGILEKVTQTINAKKGKDNTDSVSSTDYDLSGVTIKVIDKKVDYVDDEEVTFVKVAAKGSYSVTRGGAVQELTEDEIFVLMSVRNEWKVTEKQNPWM